MDDANNDYDGRFVSSVSKRVKMNPNFLLPQPSRATDVSSVQISITFPSFSDLVKSDVVGSGLLPEFGPLLVVRAWGLQPVGPAVSQGFGRHRHPAEREDVVDRHADIQTV